MNTFDEKKSTPSALDFLGNYLKKEDVLYPQIVRVVDFFEDELPGWPQSKLCVRFAEFGKPMVLNTTNIKRLVKMFGTADTRQWRGEVTLYVDHDIEFGGRTVGGLRVKPARANGADVPRPEPSKATYVADEEDLF